MPSFVRINVVSPNITNVKEVVDWVGDQTGSTYHDQQGPLCKNQLELGIQVLCGPLRHVSL